MAEILVVASKVKARLAKQGVRTSKDALERVSDHLAQVLDVAAKKAQEDGVATVKDRHIDAAVADLGVG